MTVPNWRSADLWSAIACIGLGALVLWAGADYSLGTAGRLGPGYVPRLLAWLLIGVGALLLIRTVFTYEAIEAGFGARPVLLVTASVLVFAAAFSQLGLVPAIMASVAVAAYAIPANGWRTALAVGAILSLFAWLLFVKALGLPLPVFLT